VSCFEWGREAEKTLPLAATAKVTDFRPESGSQIMEPSVARRWGYWDGCE